MKVVLQRVQSAAVHVDGKVVGEIQQGLLVLVGIADGDTASQVEKLARKTAGLRIFADDDGRMNLSVTDIGGGILAVSQFTLLADTRKGKRPAFTNAAEPAIARQRYNQYCEFLAAMNLDVQTGIFAADMQVHLVNDGPVTILLDA